MANISLNVLVDGKWYALYGIDAANAGHFVPHFNSAKVTRNIHGIGILATRTT
jgi:hypothetical protein